MGSLPELLSIGFRAGGFRGCFRGHVGLSFYGFAAAGRGRGCGEVGDRSICGQPAGAGRLSLSRLSRTSLSGFWRMASIIQIQSSTGRVGGRLYGSTGKVQVGLKRGSCVPYAFRG